MVRTGRRHVTMTETDHYRQTDFEAPMDTAPRRRRKPSALADPRTRALVAGVLEGAVAQMLSGDNVTVADQFAAGQLDEVVNELRGVE